MKTLYSGIFFIFVLTCFISAQQETEIRLLVRADDMGSSHAANVGCIASYQGGIVRSVEVMAPTPWFLEAVEMLEQNPGLDVGIHLTLNSEWHGLKWRPLTSAKSLVDTNGYFYPMVWPNDKLPPGTALYDHDWQLDDIETELRAQIELAIRHIPRISHFTQHMGFGSLDSRIESLVEKLAEEYQLPVRFPDSLLGRFKGWQEARGLQDRINRFISNLHDLQPGTYLYVHHPAGDTPEARAIGLTMDESVAEDRALVTQVFSNQQVKDAIRERNIRLISYKTVLTRCLK